MNPYDLLKLENQLCFPLYAAAKEVVRTYTPYLEGIGLTYTQYITMMVLWERRTIAVKDLGQLLYLDTGTLTPVLKKLEAKGLVSRRRDAGDERSVLVTVTEEGLRLRAEAVSIPEKVGACIPLTPEDAHTLYTLLHRMLRRMNP